MTTQLDSAFAPARPVQLGETSYTIDQDTGEILNWNGLNTDPDRCPAEACAGCPGRCWCAPCRCPDCIDRTVHAMTDPEPRPKLVLF